MRTKLGNKGLLICCAFVCLAGLVGTATAKGQASVLSRIQTISDPELGELIRVALENLPETKRLVSLYTGGKEYKTAKEVEAVARLKTVRLVTEAYVHIKLLDSQIEQSTAKLASSNVPEALARELFLAKVELESQRATKLAELREIMRIIPRHAFGRKPVKDLNGWLRLDVIGDSVLVFTRSKPFTEAERLNSHVFVKLMSAKEAMSYAVSFVTDRAHHPIRVDIMRSVDGVKLSGELEKELIRTVKRAKLELDAEVHLSQDTPRGLRGAYLFLSRGRIGEGMRSNSRTIFKELLRLVDPEDFDRYFRAVLVGGPTRLPVKFNIEYDEESKDLASRTAKAIQDAAKKLGVEKFVETVQKQTDFGEVK